MKKLSNCCFIVITPALCFFANKILKDEEAARDVVQEVFIRFYEKSYDFPNLIALKSFLYSCVQSKALNALGEAKYPDIFKTTSGHSQI